MSLLKMYSLLKIGIFHCHVSLQECSTKFEAACFKLEPSSNVKKAKHFVATRKFKINLPQNLIDLTDTMPLILILMAWHFWNYVAIPIFVVFLLAFMYQSVLTVISSKIAILSLAHANTNAMWRRCSVDPAEWKRFKDSNNDHTVNRKLYIFLPLYINIMIYIYIYAYHAIPEIGPIFRYLSTCQTILFIKKTWPKSHIWSWKSTKKTAKLSCLERHLWAYRQQVAVNMICSGYLNPKLDRYVRKVTKMNKLLRA